MHCEVLAGPEPGGMRVVEPQPLHRDNERARPMIATVHVGVALRRPPHVDEYRRIRVLVDDETDARLLACQIAACTSVMPISADLVEVGI